MTSLQASHFFVQTQLLVTITLFCESKPPVASVCPLTGCCAESWAAATSSAIAGCCSWPERTPSSPRCWRQSESSPQYVNMCSERQTCCVRRLSFWTLQNMLRNLFHRTGMQLGRQLLKRQSRAQNVIDKWLVLFQRQKYTCVSDRKIWKMIVPIECACEHLNFS